MSRSLTGRTLCNGQNLCVRISGHGVRLEGERSKDEWIEADELVHLEDMR